MHVVDYVMTHQAAELGISRLTRAFDSQAANYFAERTTNSKTFYFFVLSNYSFQNKYGLKF